MKAHKFVAEHGVEKAKAVIELNESINFKHGLNHTEVNVCGVNVNISELKQVVESLDMVAKHGGLFCLKCQIEKGGYDFEWYGENGEFGFTDLNVLEKAIADHELVESYKQVKCEVLDMVDISPNCEVRNG